MAQTTIPTKQLPIVTTVASPGLDTKIPTEQAVREAITATGANAGTKLFLYGVCQ
jgi:hypothetical protein